MRDDLYWQAAMDWLKIEHQIYEGNKFSVKDDDEKTPLDWTAAVVKYHDRARLFGLDTSPGRQSVGKAAAAGVGFLESVIRVYGTIPVPGFPSGEIRGEFKIG